MAWGLHGGTPATNIQPMWRGFGQSYTIIGAPLNSLPSHNDFMFEALDPTVLLPWDLQVRGSLLEVGGWGQLTVVLPWDLQVRSAC